MIKNKRSERIANVVTLLLSILIFMIGIIDIGKCLDEFGLRRTYLVFTAGTLQFLLIFIMLSILVLSVLVLLMFNIKKEFKKDKMLYKYFSKFYPELFAIILSFEISVFFERFPIVIIIVTMLILWYLNFKLLSTYNFICEYFDDGEKENDLLEKENDLPENDL